MGAAVEEGGQANQMRARGEKRNTKRRSRIVRKEKGLVS